MPATTGSMRPPAARLPAIAVFWLSAMVVGCTTERTESAALSGAAGPGPETEQWYFFTDDGVRHYALEIGPAGGAGEPVIVLHGGWGAEHSYLVDAVSPLADRTRFVLYDQRGSLRSPAPDSTVRLDRLVDDLEHLRRSLRLDQVTLVAHSMGNALAYAYLARHPERVARLVLIAPVHPARFMGGGSGANAAFIREVWPEADLAVLEEAVQSFLGEAGRRATAHARAAGLIPEALAEASPEEIDVFLRGLEDRERTRMWRMNFTAVNTCAGDNWRDMKGGQVYYSPSAASAIMGDDAYARLTEEFWPALQAFSGPVRVIIGTCDYVDFGPAVWPHIVPALRDAGLTVVEGTGHSIWMDDAPGFEAALTEALR